MSIFYFKKIKKKKIHTLFGKFEDFKHHPTNPIDQFIPIINKIF